MKAILKKLHAIQREVEKMSKDGINTYQHYNYLSETQVTLKMKELLDSHGVVFIHSSKISGTRDLPGGKQILTNIEVGYQFCDVESGELIEGFVAGQGADTGDKGVYKAITGAIKYIFMKNFLIPTGDDPEKDKRTPVMDKLIDDSKELNCNPQLITEPQKKRLYAIRMASGIPVEDLQNMMFEKFGYTEDKDITRKDYDVICDYARKWKA